MPQLYDPAHLAAQNQAPYNLDVWDHPVFTIAPSDRRFIFYSPELSAVQHSRGVNWVPYDKVHAEEEMKQMLRDGKKIYKRTLFGSLDDMQADFDIIRDDDDVEKLLRESLFEDD